MSTEILRELYAALNRGDIAAVVKDFDPDIVWIEPFNNPDTYRRRDVVQAHFTQARSNWAEGSCEPERFVVAGDKIVVFLHIHVRLKSETEWREGRHAAAYTFRDGKIVEMRIIEDDQQALKWVEN